MEQRAGENPQGRSCNGSSPENLMKFGPELVEKLIPDYFLFIVIVYELGGYNNDTRLKKSEMRLKR